VRPLRDFLATETSSGIVLFAAAVVALVWANSPFRSSYEKFWTTDVAISLNGRLFALDLRHVINDGLMTLFFFVAGCEIKRELVGGELADRRKASLPIIAACGGMIGPALLYSAFNRGQSSSSGWGIPMATDIAMSLGVLSLLGSRVPSPLKLLLLTLAIVDDIGAIAVIAVFYSKNVRVPYLLAAVGMALLVVFAKRIGVQSIAVYACLGCGLWIAVFNGGIHATITGVVMGLLAPTKPVVDRTLVDVTELADVSSIQAAQRTVRAARETVSVVERLEHQLHPWTSFVVLPLFALANAGVSIAWGSLATTLRSHVAVGLVLGLVVGKAVGVTGASWLAIRFRVATMPSGVTWRQLSGVAMLCGMGFTVSLFVATLAFDDAGLASKAKLGVLLASLIAAVLGGVTLRFVLPGRSPLTEESANL
jgi:Na+:H+ antiporter, NhaA family